MKYLLLLLLLGGCSQKPIQSERLKQQIVYFRDERTGLCFAAVMSADPFDQNTIRSIITVPCTKVENIK